MAVYFGSKAVWTSGSRQEAAYIATPDGKAAYILVLFAEDRVYATHNLALAPKSFYAFFEEEMKEPTTAQLKVYWRMSAPLDSTIPLSSTMTSMSIPQPLALPPGFEQLSKDQQIDYIQQLWDLILTVPDEVPVPEWHLEIVRERVSSQATAPSRPWGEVKQRLLDKYREC